MRWCNIHAEFAGRKHMSWETPADDTPSHAEALRTARQKPKHLKIEASESYHAYAENSKTRKTWLVAYGIGGPILFVSREQIWTKLAASPQKTTIVWLFLAGVAAQIAISLENKWVNWAAYAMSLNPPPKLTSRDKVVIWLANQFWVDMICDPISVIAFVVATFRILQIVLS